MVLSEIRDIVGIVVIAGIGYLAWSLLKTEQNDPPGNFVPVPDVYDPTTPEGTVKNTIHWLLTRGSILPEGAPLPAPVTHRCAAPRAAHR